MLKKRHWPQLLLMVVLAGGLATAMCWSQTEEVAPAEETAAAEMVEVPLNSHLAFECTLCHAAVPKAGESRIQAKLIKGVKNSVELCNQCHGNFNLHPILIEPAIEAPDMRVPSNLPLGFTPESREKIVCPTCHDIHLESSYNKELRGLPVRPGEKTFYENRRDFCSACHQDKLAAKNPHSQNEKSCQYCHITDPTKTLNAKETLRGRATLVCLFCHERLADEHFAKINPLADEKLQEQIQSANLPTSAAGQRTCLTCHDEHSNQKESHYLRESFIRLAEKSRILNPHDTGGFCLSCHEIDPRTTPQVTYKFDGNFIKVCSWCHSTDKVTADIHPVNIVPDQVPVKEELFPLQNGRITCITCHDHRCQTKDIDEEVARLNPKFLRGGPYANRSAMCYKCHPKNPRFDVHDQINDEGEIVPKTCNYCHATDPTTIIESGALDAVGEQNANKFTTKMTNLCTRCHQDSPHPASFLHLVTPPEKIRQTIVIYQVENNVTIPLDESGNVTCASCHNPHERGVIQKPADGYGADEVNRKRLEFICPACHSGEAGMGGQ